MDDTPAETRFQSRNRGSFHFKSLLVQSEPLPFRFQSRNRGSFHFKAQGFARCCSFPSNFNLVIEVLFISSLKRRTMNPNRFFLFQSRNRGSFHFKPVSVAVAVWGLLNFNLVIEVLFISSRCDNIREGAPHGTISIS